MSLEGDVVSGVSVPTCVHDSCGGRQTEGHLYGILIICLAANSQGTLEYIGQAEGEGGKWMYGSNLHFRSSSFSSKSSPQVQNPTPQHTHQIPDLKSVKVTHPQSLCVGCIVECELC